MPYTIAKLGYSSRPWRLLDGEAEVYTEEIFDHPQLGPTLIDGPFAADTKAELIDRVLSCLSRVSGKMAVLEAERDDAREQRDRLADKLASAEQSARFFREQAAPPTGADHARA